MEVRLEGISKKFTQGWVFRRFSQTFSPGSSYAITGHNGSGKSTLLMIASGWLLPTEGAVSYHDKNVAVEPGRFFRYLDFISPYLELIEEFTLSEFVSFHFKFNKLPDSMSEPDFIHSIYLDKETHKYIKHFSSGMKQRLKLGLGFYSLNPVLFLDEPTSNLDEEGKELYFSLFQRIKKNKIIILASNQPEEYKNCDIVIKIEDFKVANN